jgi:hypothetical protein
LFNALTKANVVASRSCPQNAKFCSPIPWVSSGIFRIRWCRLSAPRLKKYSARR